MKVSQFSRPSGWLASRSGLLFALALTVGCGGGRGTLSGKVLYNGKPVPGGVLTFRPAQAGQNTVSAQIGEDGTYQATLPLGDVQIAVDNRELQARADASPALRGQVPPGVKLPPAPKQGAAPPVPPAVSERPPGTFLPIPPRYHDIRTSGLACTVKAGAQPHDIELK